MASTRAIDVPSELKKKPPTMQHFAADSLSGTPTTSNLRRSSSGSLVTNQLQRQEPASSTTKPFHPLNLILEQEPLFPEPLNPDKCPLFCCFYAEFDIKVGPKVCFQSPHGFMDKDMSLPTKTIHEILAKTFETVRNQETQETSSDGVNSDVTDELLEKSGSDHSKQNGAKDSSLEVGLSIFDSTSEYIITGNELAGKIINLSTHYMHILTRPTVISDECYERNSLLFSVGFVLRRAEDPRTFRPLLSKWASTLRSMEVESKFLTDPTSRTQIQPMLDRLLVSLNSTKSECHVLMNQGNLLSFKRFRPPKPPALPVPDHAVPILLRRDWELHLYDWDLAINWVVMHIDGVANAKLISKRSEVDMEMVRACLRVLEHHGVIALVDIFFYSNRYEFTERATAVLAGKEPELLQQAVEYVIKVPVDSSRHSEPAYLDSLRVGESFPMLPSRSPVSSFPPTVERLSRANLRAASYRETEVRRGDDLLRSAIAELFCACTRNMSFADLWLTMTSDPPTPLSTVVKNEGSVKAGKFRQASLGSLQSSSRRATHESVAFSPPEVGYLDKSRRRHVSQSNIDWKTVFESFDHWRWATFAVVHGLIRRVYNYPLVVDVNGSNGQDGFNGRNALECSDDQSLLANEIAAMMDGTHSDDELVTEFNLPIEKLFQLVKANGVKFISSIYSTAPLGE